MLRQWLLCDVAVVVFHRGIENPIPRGLNIEPSWAKKRQVPWQVAVVLSPLLALVLANTGGMAPCIVSGTIASTCAAAGTTVSDGGPFIAGFSVDYGHPRQ